MSVAFETADVADVLREGEVSSAADTDRSSDHEGSDGGRVAQLLKYVVSLADQSFVSGTRFLTSILIGRFCGAHELGIYALGFSVMLGFQCVQMSLICRPYTILGNKMSVAERRGLAGSALMQFLIFSAAVCALMLGARGVGLLLGEMPGADSIALVLAFGLPFMLLREHARQFCFAHLNAGTAAVIDLVSSVIQVGGIAWLAYTGTLSAASAFVVAAIASGIAGCVWIWVDRHHLQVIGANVLADFRRQWTIGRWDCASEITFTTQIHGMSWLLAACMDTRSVGIYAACMMGIQLLNPFLLGVNSLLVPRTAQSFADRGFKAMNAFVHSTTWTVGAITAVFAVVLIGWGPAALEYAYQSQDFVIPPAVVTILVIGVLVEVAGMGPENGLWAMERHDLNFRVEMVAGVIALATAVPLVLSFGLTGAAVSFFVGRLATSAAHWVAYRSVVVPHVSASGSQV